MQIEFKSASLISAGLHAGVLLFALLTFSGAALDATPPESMPVDLVSVEDFSKLAKGAKDAPKAETPKPLVEKKAEEPKPAEETKPKVEETKKPVDAAKVETPPPAPERKPDPIAEKLKKDDQPKQEAQVQKPEPLPPKKIPPKPQPKFDPDKIAALLDKRTPVREASAGAELNQMPSLGATSGAAARLSQSEIDALRARLMSLWNPPVGIQKPEDFVIRIRMRLTQDGRLSGPPMVLSSGTGQIFNSARDSAIRAVFQGQPFTMLKPEHYEMWKDMEITFDPRDMIRG